jgi:hypothetical protein
MVDGETIHHRILVIGDSHARGLAMNLKQKLSNDYEVQGIVKPGSTLESLINTASLT